jgi:hypothetical protein
MEINGFCLKIEGDNMRMSGKSMAKISFLFNFNGDLI